MSQYPFSTAFQGELLPEPTDQLEAVMRPKLVRPDPEADIKDKLSKVADHMKHQLNEHHLAVKNTDRIFDELLAEMKRSCGYFQEMFTPFGNHHSAKQDHRQIYQHVDADRSVGILNLIWQTISFTTRGNTKPMALPRKGRLPLFTGRIVAVHGDFQQLHSYMDDSLFPDLLDHEIASLFIPADKKTPAIMKVRHLEGEEFQLNQDEAAREFLMKVIQVTCGGGFFHENISV